MRYLFARWCVAGAAAFVCLVRPASALAADTTPPTTPLVTDDGAYTTNTTQLHATWTSADPESGIAEYQYLIRQDSTSGTIIVPWTSTGTTAAITRTGLSLLHGKSYFFQVKARNGANLWSSVGSSNGIKVDTTPPTAPGLPKEGSASSDQDYDGDGKYTVYWAAAADAESKISAYEVQERVGPSGAWTTLTSSRTARKFAVSGRLDKTRYVYQVRAKNGVGLWGAFSPASDGILV
ncbi:MAG: fibronectin type III domain-containing protein, partial [Candidatus Omnitrophica bacterium]|nr:fibronectin type III domain-containing protein [Candidatus Omnitrophota bacterium]